MTDDGGAGRDDEPERPVERDPSEGESSQEPNERTTTRTDESHRRHRSGRRAAASTPTPDGEASPSEGETLSEPRPDTIREPTGPAILDPETIEEYTTGRRALDPTVQLQWGVRTAIGSVILGMITLVVLGRWQVSAEYGGLVILAFLLLGAIWVGLRYRVWVYQIRSDSVHLERGVVTHVRTIVPYVRIQHVDTSRGPLERALGLSTLVVYTAGSRGADVSIPGLKPDEARDLQHRLKELAIEAEGDDAV